MPDLIDFVEAAAEDSPEGKALASSVFKKMNTAPDADALLAFFRDQGFDEVTDAEIDKILRFERDLAGARDY